MHNLQLISFCVFLFLAWLGIVRLKFFRESGMSVRLLQILLLLKLLTGFFLGWLTLEYLTIGNDYKSLHDYGLAESQILINHPSEYIHELFRSSYLAGRGGWFDSTASYWNDLENNLIIKFLAILNLFTQGNYYSNSIFFNFFSFAGHVALYRLFVSLYGKTNEKAILFASFFIPATLFFSSGIHKDLIIFTCLSLFFYLLYSMSQQKTSRKRWLFLILTLTLMALIRNYVLIALLPAVSGYLLAQRLKVSGTVVFTVTFCFFLLLIVSLNRIAPEKSPLSILAKKRMDFLHAGKANTELPAFILKPETGSLIKHLPNAFHHAFLRPFPGEGRHPLHKIAGIELTILWLIITLGIWKLKGNPLLPFEWMMISFGCIALLFIGYVVPNYGSIIRYRCLYLPVLIIPFLMRAVRRRIY